MEMVVGPYASAALGLAITAGAIAVARRADTPTVWVAIRHIESALQTRSMAAATAVATAAVVWWYWGSLHQVAVVQDERAYLLQAAIFAAGHWTAHSPPLPQFFEQMHVLVTPVVAAKYPPGHALILAAGVWLGLPGLAPLVLSAIAGALVFMVSRRLAGPWVALLTWGIWVTAGATIAWWATYFSETTTATLWLLGWWSLLEWRSHHRWWAMASLGACAGWGAITRPLSMLVFTVPVAAVVVMDIYRRRTWGDIIPGLVAGIACLAIIPVWSAQTTGNWRVTPLAEYTREYIPWDHPGLGYDSTPPLRTLPADLDSMAGRFIRLHKAYTVSAVAPALRARLRYLRGDLYGGWRRVLLPLGILGLFALTGDVVVAVATMCLLILAYLSYAYFPNWTLYYLEIAPVLAFLAARGIWICVNRGSKERAGLAVVLLVIAGASCSVPDLRAARATHIAGTSDALRFRRALDRLGTGKVLIFVRYGPEHPVHSSVIGNVPDLATARTWLAYDRGAENQRLMTLAPGRTAYLYDEGTGTFSPLSGTVAGSHGPPPAP
jgi:hypothetical protein